MIWIFWLSSRPAIEPPSGLSYTVAAIAGHFALYAVLTVLLLFALSSASLTMRKLVVIAAAIASVYAISDEFHQSFVASRDASLADVAVDGLGILFSAVIWSVVWRRTETS